MNTITVAKYAGVGVLLLVAAAALWFGTQQYVLNSQSPAVLIQEPETAAPLSDADRARLMEAGESTVDVPEEERQEIMHAEPNVASTPESEPGLSDVDRARLMAQ